MCLTHHLYNLRQQGGRPNPLGFHHEAAGGVHRSTHHLGSHRFFYRDGLAGHHRFVHRAVALDHRAIHRHFFTGANAQQVTDSNLAESDIGLASVARDAARGFRGQTEQGLDRAAGLAASPQLQHLPQQDQNRNDGSCFEVKTDMPGGVAKRSRKETGRDHGNEAVKVSSAASNRDQGEHIEAAMNNRRPAALKEGPSAPQDDRRCQGKLSPSQRPTQ